MIRLDAQTLFSAVTAALLISSGAAHAEMIKYSAVLSGAAEVPPTETAATGSAEFTVDTEAKTVAWVYMTEGLSDDAAAAHIHGPASMTENAPPVIEVAVEPLTGSAPITDEQAADMAAGNYYFNIHTEKFPDGEIRGQIVAAP
jgi:hypothetical protein